MKHKKYNKAQCQCLTLTICVDQNVLDPGTSIYGANKWLIILCNILDAPCVPYVYV